MNTINLDSGPLAAVCDRVTPTDGIAVLVQALNQVLPLPENGLDASHVLTRAGWHRLGGVVDCDYRRVADHIGRWAEQQSDGDVDQLMDAYIDHGYFATRWQGRTHFITVPLGPGAADYLQIEIEELQEVIDRILIDRDWFPESIQEFIEPLELPRLEPEPIGKPRYQFRRATRIDALLEELDPTRSATASLKRFVAEWQASSASAHTEAFCRHWVLTLQETPDGDGGSRFSARPTAANAPKPGACGDPEGLKGAMLANWLQRLDREAGYPFAWYFLMLASRVVPVSVGERVRLDLEQGFDYLPERDARLIKAWSADPYHF